MSSVNKTRIFSVVALLIVFSTTSYRVTAASDQPACDVAADVALALGDYSTAITLNQRLLQSEPNNALAHYHLGFAYGMVGRTADEINEYRTAVNLGLEEWDLFLNLGLAYFDRHQMKRATVAFETAVSLGPQHAVTHFDLAVAYERENRLHEAFQQIVAALALAPQDLDAANTEAIICARLGDVGSARHIWTRLIRAAPDYAPARTNLALLNRSCGGACGPHARSQRTAILSR